MAERQLILKAHGSTAKILPSISTFSLIHHLMRHDPHNTQTALRDACLDLATRALVPHLHETEPRTPDFQGVTLTWLPKDSVGLRILSDKSLKDLAACPALALIWNRFAQIDPDTKTVLQAFYTGPQTARSATKTPEDSPMRITPNNNTPQR